LGRDRLPGRAFCYESDHTSERSASGVDTDMIEATFKKGILTVTWRKSADAQKAEKKITVKAA
jgi:HSP20 family protein